MKLTQRRNRSSWRELCCLVCLFGAYSTPYGSYCESELVRHDGISQILSVDLDSEFRGSESVNERREGAGEHLGYDQIAWVNPFNQYTALLSGVIDLGDEHSYLPSEK